MSGLTLVFFLWVQTRGWLLVSPHPRQLSGVLVQRSRYLYTVSRESSQGMKEEHSGQNFLIVASNDACGMLLMEMPLF